MDNTKKKLRCAVYTRKSVEDGLEQEFNSLDAQREAGEAYIASQKSNGWVCLPKHYEDGGFSGGNMNRPGLKELMEDAEAGLIDVIVVYKIDRLSRSICDFATLSKKFDEWNVAFVSVTQEINTHTSSGRMMLNILITFAQFEREVIAERIKDKMSASRKKGKWVGGTVPFGYTVNDKKLIINPDEAGIVKKIFARYIEVQSPKQIAIEMKNAGIRRKRTGQPWSTHAVLETLKRHVYVGDVFYDNQVWKGEHKAIIDRKTWDTVQQFIATTASEQDCSRREDSRMPLKGILRCGHCDGAMTTAYSTGRKGRRYFYYQCSKDAKRPESICPTKSIPAGTVEKLVYEQLQKVLLAPEIVLAVSKQTGVRPRDITEMFSNEMWNEMSPGEKYRLVQLLVERVVVNPESITMEIKTSGIKSIMEAYGNAE